ERGVQLLRGTQFPDGSWPELSPQMDGGVTALSTLALLNAGVPSDDPQIQLSLNILQRAPLQSTYVVALQTMVYSIAEPHQHLQLLRRNVRWLEGSQKSEARHRGMWSYPIGAGDNSNSQFAILALYEAHRADVPVSPLTFRTALAYWQTSQNNDG